MSFVLGLVIGGVVGFMVGYAWNRSKAKIAEIALMRGESQRQYLQQSRTKAYVDRIKCFKREGKYRERLVKALEDWLHESNEDRRQDHE